MISRAMRNDDDPIARMTFLAGLLREALEVADAEQEFMIAAKLDETLTCVRERIEKMKGAA